MHSDEKCAFVPSLVIDMHIVLLFGVEIWSLFIFSGAIF